MARLFRAEIENYFDRKTYFDFRNYDLQKLDIELLSSKAKEVGFEDKIQEKLA
jgi:hypothetical protein